MKDKWRNQKCTRCHIKLIEKSRNKLKDKKGYIRKNWHYPICEECRFKMMSNTINRFGETTKEEKKICDERFKAGIKII